MSMVEIEKGVVVELPDTWTPLMDEWSGFDVHLVHVDIALTRSWLPDATPHELWHHGATFTRTFRLLRGGVIELAERLLLPGNPFRLINFFPLSEFAPDNFDIVRGGNLVHRLTGRIFFAVHYRIRRPAQPSAARQAPAIIKPSPATVSLPAPKPRALRLPGIQARRVRLVHDNEEALGWPSRRHAYDMVRAARDAAVERKDASAIADLAGLERNDNPVFELRQAVEILRNNPQAAIEEILRRLRAPKPLPETPQ